MLAFDIETMGLCKYKDPVTIVCCEDYETGQKTAFEFAKCRREDPSRYPDLVQEMVAMLNAAPALCAFNGIRFDIPFLEQSFGISKDVVTGWVLKTVDILEYSRLVHKSTFGLNLLCEHNHVPMKSSSGTQAIVMAREGRWDDLKTYCEDDVHILCTLYAKEKLKHPRSGQYIMRRDFAPSCLLAINKS